MVKDINPGYGDSFPGQFKAVETPYISKPTTE